jgi:hypothetical protein
MKCLNEIVCLWLMLRNYFAHFVGYTCHCSFMQACWFSVANFICSTVNIWRNAAKHWSVIGNQLRGNRLFWHHVWNVRHSFIWQRAQLSCIVRFCYVVLYLYNNPTGTMFPYIIHSLFWQLMTATTRTSVKWLSIRKWQRKKRKRMAMTRMSGSIYIGQGCSLAPYEFSMSRLDLETERLVSVSAIKVPPRPCSIECCCCI